MFVITIRFNWQKYRYSVRFVELGRLKYISYYSIFVYIKQIIYFSVCFIYLSLFTVNIHYMFINLRMESIKLWLIVISKIISNLVATISTLTVKMKPRLDWRIFQMWIWWIKSCFFFNFISFGYQCIHSH